VGACWTFIDTNFGVNWKTCSAPTISASVVDIASSDVVINTDNGTSTDPNVTCVPVDVTVKAGNGSEIDGICAVVASSITVESGHLLSATGSRPLALFAHTISIQGTIDVGSHIPSTSSPGTLGTRGPGSGLPGCIPGTSPGDSATGGNGGYFGTDGGLGGNQPNSSSGSTSGTTLLRGGCDGMLARKVVSIDTAGAGGGAIWISSDTGQLTIGDNAVINASGAGGHGGVFPSRGGSGGGSGGLIVLQSSAIAISPTSSAQIFANGGGGGGGGSLMNAGGDGGEPTNASSAGNAGPGGSGNNSGAPGGQGSSNTGPKASGGAGMKSDNGGSGGGGGGAGIIRIDTSSDLLQSPFSPPPMLAAH
jgi:hypothetical protein